MLLPQIFEYSVLHSENFAVPETYQLNLIPLITLIPLIPLITLISYTVIIKLGCVRRARESQTSAGMLI